MFISSVGAINNSAFGVMQARNGISNLAKSTGDVGFGGDLAGAQRSEKMLQSSNLNNQFIYDASGHMEEAQKKLEKENIKRTFSTFA